MELRRRFARSRLFERVSCSIREFQARRSGAKPDAQKIKILRGLTLVFLSIVLGWISLQATESSSIARYRLHAWPQASVWRLTLDRAGLVLRPRLGDYGRQLQTHPQAFSNERSIWVSNDGCLVYLPASPYRDGEPELRTCVPEPKPPSHWIQAGPGLEGFENLVAFLGQIPQKTPPSPHSRRNLIDPKEIRY